MTFTITDVYDKERLCGWRKNGLYLRADGPSQSCGMLPLMLRDCACCGHAIKLTRGLQRVNVEKLIENERCSYGTDNENCRLCLINRTRMGYLIGVGAKFYKSQWDYMREAIEQGISKRIAQIPRDLEVGKSVILIGHPKVFSELVPEEAIDQPVIEIEEDAVQKRLPMIEGHSLTTGRMVAKDIAGVICLFVPTAIEYVVNGQEADEQLQRLADRGISLVRIHRLEEKQAQMAV